MQTIIKFPEEALCRNRDAGRSYQPQVKTAGSAVAAEAILNENFTAQEHMLAAYPSLQGMYKPGDGNTAVFYLKNGTATICSFTEAPNIVNF